MKLGIYERIDKKYAPKDPYYYLVSKDVNKRKMFYITDLNNSHTWTYNWTQKKMIKKLKQWKWKHCRNMIIEIF
jgi:hypothetical protein